MYKNCDDGAAKDGGSQVFCSNKRHTYRSLCDLLCDKYFIDRTIKADYAGICGSTNRIELEERFKF